MTAPFVPLVRQALPKDRRPSHGVSEVGQFAPQAPVGRRVTNRYRATFVGFSLGIPPNGHCGAIAPTFRTFDPWSDLLDSGFSDSEISPNAVSWLLAPLTPDS